MRKRIISMLFVLSPFMVPIRFTVMVLQLLPLPEIPISRLPQLLIQSFRCRNGLIH